jgi:hypothetical protein
MHLTQITALDRDRNWSFTRRFAKRSSFIDAVSPTLDAHSLR